MRILVTNDDGIYAPGLWTLAEGLTNVGEVVVVAPDREQSAIGSAITLHQPLRVTEISPLVPRIEAYSVEGTPSDSIILALNMLLKDPVDLVFSGINQGANLGDDVLLSGTIGGALQGYFRGLPAVAISVALGENMHFEVASEIATRLASKLSSGTPAKGILLNVNLPNLPRESIAGIECTTLARRAYLDAISEGFDGKRKYYWIVRGKPQWEAKVGTDYHAIHSDKISITALHSNLSDSSQRSLVQSIATALLEEYQPSENISTS